MSAEREKILGRVREALSVAAPRPGHAEEPGGGHAPTGELEARRWLPAVGATLEERLALFQKHTTALKADFVLLNSAEEITRRLLELRDAENWKKVGAHSGRLIDRVLGQFGIPVLLTDKGYEARDLESCDAGISECDALVAQTGSVLVTSRSAGGRALSVLPPHHVVLARREQLVADLPEAFAVLKGKYATNYPSFVSLITGPSRTGDIERILVLGAHGPKKLTILCV
jgi:L-lactate dehydrogenase complex protein LldG